MKYAEPRKSVPFAEILEWVDNLSGEEFLELLERTKHSGFVGLDQSEDHKSTKDVR